MGMHLDLAHGTSATLVLGTSASVFMQLWQAITEGFEQRNLVSVQGLWFQLWQGQFSQTRARVAHSKERRMVSLHPAGKPGERGQMIVGRRARQTQVLIQKDPPQQYVAFEHRGHPLVARAIEDELAEPLQVPGNLFVDRLPAPPHDAPAKKPAHP